MSIGSKILKILEEFLEWIRIFFPPLFSEFGLVPNAL